MPSLEKRLIEPRKAPVQRRSKVAVATILDAAARILEEGGLEALNTNRVAAVAGFSVGSLYQYFPSKEAILAALIRRKREALTAAFAEGPDLDEAPDLETALRILIRGSLAEPVHRPALNRVLAQAQMTLPFAAETRALKARLVERAAGVLARFEIADPALAARDCLALSHGMIDTFGEYEDPDPATLEARILSAIMGYLHTRSACFEKPDTPSGGRKSN